MRVVGLPRLSLPGKAARTFRNPEANTWTVVLPAFGLGGISLFDLVSTLPAGAKPGGTFGVHASGAALPAGMALSTGGILSVGTAIDSAAGVVFSYQEPADDLKLKNLKNAKK